MFVSYIVATLNCFELTKDFITHINSLEREDIEVLVSDGGSTDGTIDALARSRGIRVIKSAPDAGIYDAWNCALGHAAGDYIAFIGIDDRPGGRFLNAAKNIYLNAIHPPGLIYGNALVERNGRYRCRKIGARSDFVYTDSVVFDFAHPGSLNHRDLFEGTNFDSRFKLAGDIDFYLGVRTRLRHMGALKIEEIQATVGANGLSNSVEAYQTYFEEFKIISRARSVDFGLVLIRYRIMAILRYLPTFFDIGRNISWILNSSSRTKLG